MYDYQILHREGVRYHAGKESLPGVDIYNSINGWKDYWLGEHLVFSHRNSRYFVSYFPEHFHAHNHYELVFLVKGDVTFMAEDVTLSWEPGCLMVYGPGVLHTSKISQDTDYERYVLYFDEEAFACPSLPNLSSEKPIASAPQPGPSLSPLLAFARRSRTSSIRLPAEHEDECFHLLRLLEKTLNSGEDDAYYLSMSILYRFFYIINHHGEALPEIANAIPESARKIKHFVDANFRTLYTVSDIADHFFYSREYVARLFKEHFGSALTDYLSSLKLRESKILLQEGASVTEACFSSGFRNMSTFTEAFKSSVQMTPSAYRREHRKTQAKNTSRP